MAIAINNSGEVVGTYTDGDGSHVFTYSGGSSGTYTSIDPAPVSGEQANAIGIDASGDVVGNYWSGGVEYGFLDQSGTITTLSYTGAGDTPLNTQVVGIDNSGEVIGDYSVGGKLYGFIYTGGADGVYIGFSLPSAQETVITGINSAGEITGYYIDFSDSQIGFVADPQAALTLTDGTTVTGGTLSVSVNDVLSIESGANGGVALDNVTLDNSALVLINPNATLTVADTVTLTGGGLVILASAVEQVAGTITGDSTVNPGLLNNVDNTITGTGYIGIGDQTLSFTNEIGGTVDASGAGSFIDLDTGNPATNAGLLEATSGGTLYVFDSIDNSGNLTANGGEVVIESGAIISGPVESVTITGGGLADFVGFSDNPLDLNAVFSGVGAGTLELDHSRLYGGAVSGFGQGDLLDLRDLTYASNEYAVWTQVDDAGGTLQIYDVSGTPEETLNLAGTYGQSDFALTADSASTPGTEVLYTSVDTWTGSGSDSEWSDAANWSNGTPGEGAEVSLPNSASAYTVTFDKSSSPDTIYTLATNENALDIASGSSLTVLGSVAKDGTIVDDGSLTVGGAVSGNGSLTIDGTATIGSLTLPGQTLTGNGSLTIAASLTWDSASTMYVTMDVAYGATATITNTVYLDSTLEIDGQVNVDGNVTLGSAYPSGSPADEGIVDINSDGTLTMTGGSIASSFGTPHYGYVDNSGNIIGDAPGSASISEAIT